MTKTQIQINGKSYDAITGKLIGSAPVSHRPSRSIDGVMRAPQHHTTPGRTGQTARKAHAVAPSATTPKPHTAQTLARHAVSKPVARSGSHFKAVIRTDILATQPSVNVAPKLSALSIDKRRVARAKRVARSKLISRFGPMQISQAALSAPATTINLALPAAPTVAHQPRAKSPAPLPPRGPKSMDIFQRALENATTHELPPVPPKTRAHATRHKRRHSKAHRLANASAAAVAVVAVGGFLAYQSLPSVNLHLASRKAGFAATLPAYKPAGFSLGKFAYSPGKVSISFHSNSDDTRNFAVIERPTNWDSNTLLNDYVATAAPTYQTVESTGHTIYLYNSKATWVDNGIWYQVSSQGLSQSQLINLAASM